MSYLSLIGVILRDSHGVAQVNLLTGKTILQILKKNGMAPNIPEDLYHMIKKAVSVRKHLQRNRKVSFHISIIYKHLYFLLIMSIGICGL